MSTSIYLALVAMSVYAIRRSLRKSPPAPLPPGPKGLPIIGNAFDWPKEKAWEVFAEWGKVYGPMVYTNLAGQHILIINDCDVAFEILDRKGAIYSDRPKLYMACELVLWKNSMVMMSYGKPMREQRDLVTRTIGSKAALATYESVMTAEVQRFIGRVIDEPGCLSAHVRILAGSIVLNIAYGHQVEDGHSDEFVKLGTKLMDEFGDASMPGRYIVDIFPIIDRLPSWFPGLQYREIAARMRQTLDEFLDKPYEYVQAQLAAGTARPSFITGHIDGVNLTPEFENRVKQAASALWGGGTDTTVSAICTFFLAMTLYPEVQLRARTEIEAVLGAGCLPSVTDRSRLPYMEALFLEVLRYGQVGPLGIPHVSREDDVHHGYFIPKGTMVIPNIWKFSHDAGQYHDPMTFDPTRFLHTHVHTPEPNPREHVFGYGRRACPGQQLAEHSVWLTCATSLATLSITKSLDQDGMPIVPEVEYIGQAITHPKDFPCTIKARSPKAETLVYDALQDAS